MAEGGSGPNATVLITVVDGLYWASQTVSTVGRLDPKQKLDLWAAGGGPCTSYFIASVNERPLS